MKCRFHFECFSRRCIWWSLWQYYRVCSGRSSNPDREISEKATVVSKMINDLRPEGVGVEKRTWLLRGCTNTDLIEGPVKALRLGQMCIRLPPSLALMRNPLMFSRWALLLVSFGPGLDWTVFCRFLLGCSCIGNVDSQTSEQLQTSHRIT